MNTNQIARIAALVGEPARTAMLLELMDGRRLTAHELANAGNVSAQTGSQHLARLVEAGLVLVEPQGRHRYHRLASGDVARLLEGLMQLAAQQAPARRAVVPGPKDAAMRTARSCYDHLAGRLGVAIAEHLQADAAIVFDGDVGHVTGRGAAMLERLGLVPAPDSAPSRRAHCRPCLDWSERRFHIGGRVGASIFAGSLERGWLRRRADSRALDITPAGAVALRNWLGAERWDRLFDAAPQPAPLSGGSAARR